MMMKQLVSILCCVGLVACSGGGGGGGEAAPTGRPKTGIRILHANIDVAPIDAYADGVPAALARARFSEASSYKALGAGSYVVNIAVANVAPTVVASEAIVLADGDVKSLLLFGDRANFGVRTAVIDNPLLELGADEAMVRVVHGAIGAATVQATAASVSLSPTAFGEASEYVAVPVGEVALRATRAIDGAVVYASTHTLEGGRAYTLLLSGDMAYFATGRLIVDQG